MKELLFVFWNVARLRAAPQTLPASPFLLQLVLCCHLLVGFGVALFSFTAADALLSALTGTALMVLLISLFLLIQRRRPRVLQTLVALAGCEVIVGLLLLPATVLMGLEAGSLRDFGVMATLLGLAWNIAIVTHVLRYALDVGRALGLGYALGYFSLSIILLEQVVK